MANDNHVSTVWCPCLWQGAGTRGSLRSFQSQNGLGWKCLSIQLHMPLCFLQQALLRGWNGGGMDGCLGWMENRPQACHCYSASVLLEARARIMCPCKDGMSAGVWAGQGTTSRHCKCIFLFSLWVRLGRALGFGKRCRVLCFVSQIREVVINKRGSGMR